MNPLPYWRMAIGLIAYAADREEIHVEQIDEVIKKLEQQGYSIDTEPFPPRISHPDVPEEEAVVQHIQSLFP